MVRAHLRLRYKLKTRRYELVATIEEQKTRIVATLDEVRRWIKDLQGPNDTIHFERLSITMNRMARAKLMEYFELVVDGAISNES